MKQRLDKSTIEKIKFLRSQGHSLPEISRALDIAKSTAFRHVQNVYILPQFVSDWASKRGGSKKRKLLKETAAFEQGKKLIGTLSKKEKLLFISALYWAEGNKKDFSLINSDPELIKIFVNGMKEVLGVKDNQLRVSIRVYEDLDKERCLSFWSDIVGVSKERFTNVNTLPGKKKGKLVYGMCRVRVAKGGDLLKKIIGVTKAVSANLAP